MFVDTHSHLTDQKLLPNIEEVVREYTENKVTKVVDIGCEVKTSIMAKDNAERFDSVYFTAGVHPSEIHTWKDDTLDELFKLTAHEKCVAIGEIGLDYHYEPYDKQRQKECFIAQLELAKTAKLPVNIHIRDSMGDATHLFRENRDKLTYGGVMHCYSGSRESARELMDMGLFIAFGGTVTFKNARNLLDVARYVPMDRILTETDSPFLAPEGFRGTVNSPKHIPVIAQKLAELKEMQLPLLAEKIMQNALGLFGKLK